MEARIEKRTQANEREKMKKEKQKQKKAAAAAAATTTTKKVTEGGEGEQQMGTCSMCDEKAMMECVTCGMTLCSQETCHRRLSVAHEKLRGQNKHDLDLILIARAARTAATGGVGVCEEHGLGLELFCLDDNVPVCHECVYSPAPTPSGPATGARQSGKHSRHGSCKIEEAAKNLRGTLEVDSMRLETTKKAIEASRAEHGRAIEAVEDQAREATEEIERIFAELERSLKERKGELKRKCERIAEAKVRAIREHEGTVVHSIGRIAEVESMAVTAVTNADEHPISVCSRAPVVHERVSGFLNSMARAAEAEQQDELLKVPCEVKIEMRLGGEFAKKKKNMW